MKKSIFVLAAALTVLATFCFTLAVTAQRSTNPERRQPRRMEDFDVRANLERTLAAPPQQKDPAGRRARAARQSTLLRERPAAQLRFNSFTGTPSRLYSFTQALSAPSSQAPAVAVKSFLKKHNDLFHLRADELEGLRVARQYATAHNGVTHLTLQQQLNEIEIFQAAYAVHLDRAGQIIAASGELFPAAARATNLSRPALGAAAALRRATVYAAAESVGALKLKAQAAGQEQQQRFANEDGARAFGRDVEARLVYFPVAADELRLAWEFTLWMAQTPDVYLIIVDAEHGYLLYRQNLTLRCFEDVTVAAVGQAGSLPWSSAESDRTKLRQVASLPDTSATAQDDPRGLVYLKDSPRPNTPSVTNSPATVERQELIFRAAPFNSATIFPANDPHFDWWAGQAPIGLVSNNTDTRLDRDANNRADEPRLNIADGNFSFPIDLTQPPTTEDNQKAAQANLFYWVNRYHDILYHFGFNEAAGNFQTDNFGLGGAGDDAVVADAQDGSGTNNANFTTPPDGSPGRMQMYLWTTATPALDSDFDQGIIIHELTHGLSNRLVGNATGLSGTHGGGMGEGWSDYFSIVLLSEAGDDLAGTYAIGQYANNNYGAGIRRFPYSTSASVYPFNFGDIWRSTAVHAVGEIWCNALLEMRALLIGQHGFQEGQRQSLQLVVDGLKLTPSNPTFLDARNAIMLADKINNGGANQSLLWQAFSKRGMGFDATALDARDGQPLESFVLPPFTSDLGAIRFDQPNYLLGETIKISVGDRNAATVQVRVRSTVTGDQETLPLNTGQVFIGDFSASLRLVPGPANAGDNLLQASLSAGDKIVVTYEDADNGAGAAVQITTQTDVAGEKIVFEDTSERGNAGWNVAGTPAQTWTLSEGRAASGVRAWSDSPVGNYAAGTDTSLVSPLFDLSRAGGVVLTFAHSYAFTNGIDYGEVEYSIDDGQTWRRATAFTGTQSNFTQARVALDALAGQGRARIRFRLRAQGSNDGWTIDDIRLIARSSDLTFIPPPSQLAPLIAGLAPAFGSPDGNTTVTISGLNFTQDGDVRVFFDNQPATNVRVLGGGTIVASTPAHQAGAAAVRVETRYGAAMLANAFTYHLNGSTTGAPKLTNIFPTSGATGGGTLVTITGENFAPDTAVAFGTQNARVTFVNANTLHAVTPAANAVGAVDVTTSNGAQGQARLMGGFSYTAPTPPLVRLLSPDGGERLFTGQTVTLRWQSSDNGQLARHRLALVRGSNITIISDNIAGEAQSFNWTIPANLNTTNEARIRVIAVDGDGAQTEVRSSNDFTIERRWQTQTVLPSALNRSAAAADQQHVYVIGGRTTTSSQTSVSSVRRLRPAAGQPTWEPLAALPAALNSAEAAHINGKIYVPGGINQNAELERNQFVYDIAGNSWAILPAPPVGTHAYGLTVDGERGVYYLTGGSDLIAAGLAAVQAFDTRSNTWTAAPPMTTARFAHESIWFNGKLYVAGGAGAVGTLASGEVFDPKAQQWSPLPHLNVARWYASSALGRDESGQPIWLIIGGEDGNGAPLSSVEAYDFAANRWTLLDHSFGLPSGRTRGGAATLGDFVYSIGGSAGASSASTHERLALSGIALINVNQPPLIAVPAAQQIAIANQELSFTVTAQDLNAPAPVTIAAEGLPAGASFTVNNETNNSARGTFRWTPDATDTGRSFTINFSAGDGQLTDVKTVVIKVVTATPLAAANAADFRPDALSVESIAAAFGNNLAPRVEMAQSLPLPLEMSGTTLTVNGIPAPLFFVAPTQINFQVPAGVAPGPATLVVSNGLGNYALGNIAIAASAPAIFTANATGRGDAAALATIDGVNFEPPPFDVLVGGRPNILLLFGTGIRRAPATNPNDDNGVAEAVTVTIDSRAARVLYAGAQGAFAGLDQINVELPANLVGTGPRSVEVVVTINSVTTNRVTVPIK